MIMQTEGYAVGQRAGNFTLQNADTILFLGTRNNIRQVSYNWENYAKNAYKIVVDIDNAELNKSTIKPDLKINADLACFMPELDKIFEKLEVKSWLEFSKKLLNKYSFEKTKEYQSINVVINPYDFVHTLSEIMEDNDILITANGSACVCAHQAFIVKNNQRVFWNSGNASMGYGLPAAIGAYYEAKGRNVICLEGDGSIMMNIQELQTIVHNKIPLKIFIINNAGYSSIRQTQRNFFSGHMTGSGNDSGVSVPDFCKLANGFGLKSEKISDPKTMKNIIENVLKMQEPVICEVMTEQEYSFSPKLSARKLDDGTMISPTLEDMSPFLDRKEFEGNLLNK